MKKSFYKQSVTLRKLGWSYNVIMKRVGVSKSTLSNWLGDIPYTPNKTIVRRIKNGPAKSAAKRHQQKMDNIIALHKKAAIEIGQLSKRDLQMLGIGLYIGEGSKKFEEVRLVNSNPRVIQLYINWLTRVCGVPKGNLQFRCYVYPDTNINDTLKFWQKITGFSSSAFVKTIIDQRKDKKTKKWSQLPHGTLNVIVRGYGNKSLGVTLHRRIVGWTEAVYKQAGVV